MLHGLLAFWLSIIVVALALAWLLIQLSQQSLDAQLARARSASALSCETLSAGLERLGQLQPTQTLGSPGWQAAAQAVIDLGLRDHSGVEGGFWVAGRGVIAYAFPTYDGTGIKRDPPAAELQRIEATAQRAADSHSLVLEVRPGLREAVVFSACVGSEQATAPVAWTLMRVPTVSAQGQDTLILALSLLLGFVLLSGAWLLWTLSRFAKRLQASEAAAVRLAQELAQAERMAVLGRMSAGLAHEIRNPLATMRMKVENALAAPADTRERRTRSALQVVLEQAGRLETLVSSLLALSQPVRVERQPVDLQAWLVQGCEFHQEAAAHRQVTLEAEPRGELGQGHFDPQVLQRALDNLLLNALAHVPEGGWVRVGLQRLDAARLLLWVQDNGEGVDPSVRDSLFNPFVTGRADGYGLGLAFVMEAARAHDGTVRLLPCEQGARFEVEWRG